MPLIRIDAVKGRTDEEIRKVLDATHRAVVAAFKVPQRDRYQVYHEHAAAHMIAEDTGLGFTRTAKVLIFSITSRPRERATKLVFYKELCCELETSCGVAASDVIVSVSTNTDADWSFGNGIAQFITGEL